MEQKEETSIDNGRPSREHPDDIQIASLTPKRSRLLLDSLTSRQLEVMTELAHYRERKEISRDLDISYTRTSQILDAVKERFGIQNLSKLKLAFFIASYQCDRPVFKQKQLRTSSAAVHSFVAAGRYGDLYELFLDPDFRQFIRDRRSSGWRALDAWFGMGWRPIAIVFAAAVLIVIVSGVFFASDWITARFESEPSSTTMETTPMETTKSQMLSDQFHGIEAEARALQDRLAEQLILATDIARTHKLSATETQRTTRHLTQAIANCDQMIASMGMSHSAAKVLGERLNETRADIPWSCPKSESEKPDLQIVG